MKKLLALILIIWSSAMFGQVIVHNQPVKLKQVALGTTVDSLVVIGSDGLTKYLPISSLPIRSGGASLQTEYKFSTSIAAADPGTGRVAYNNAVPANVTQIYLSETTDLGFDASGVLSTIDEGDVAYVQQKGDATRYAEFNIEGPAVDNGAWWTIPVSAGSTGALPSNNALVSVIYNLNPPLLAPSVAIVAEDEGAGLTYFPQGDDRTEKVAGGFRHLDMQTIDEFNEQGVNVGSPGDQGVTIGTNNYNQAFGSLIVGDNNVATNAAFSAFQLIAGWGNTSGGYTSFATGTFNTSLQNYSFQMGHTNNIGSGGGSIQIGRALLENSSGTDEILMMGQSNTDPGTELYFSGNNIAAVMGVGDFTGNGTVPHTRTTPLNAMVWYREELKGMVSMPGSPIDSLNSWDAQGYGRIVPTVEWTKDYVANNAGGGLNYLDFTSAGNYTTVTAQNGFTVVMTAGTTITLDDAGVTVADQFQFENRTGSPISFAFGTGDTAYQGAPPDLPDGAFAYAKLTAANTWSVMVGGGGGGSGSTNLGYTASPLNGTVTSDTGTDATLPLADGTNAGLMTPADFTKLAGINLSNYAQLGVANNFTAASNNFRDNIQISTVDDDSHIFMDSSNGLDRMSLYADGFNNANGILSVDDLRLESNLTVYVGRSGLSTQLQVNNTTADFNQLSVRETLLANTNLGVTTTVDETKAGTVVFLTGSSNDTLTIPDTWTQGSGAHITFVNIGTGTKTITVSGTATINGGVNPIVLAGSDSTGNESVMLVQQSSNTDDWFSVGKY